MNNNEIVTNDASNAARAEWTEFRLDSLIECYLDAKNSGKYTSGDADGSLKPRVWKECIQIQFKNMTNCNYSVDKLKNK